MELQLLVGSPPHLRGADSINRIMWSAAAALIPAVAMSLYFFGLGALKVYLIAIAAAEAAELVCLKVRGKPISFAADGSAFVAGVLLAMVLPPGVAWYCPLIGGVFAIAIVKHAFGGLGNNVWNPALAARVFLQVAYPMQISLGRWPAPRTLWGPPVAAVTMASPLSHGPAAMHPSYLDLLLGNGVAGDIGETCKVALLVGAVFLIVLKIVDWRIPAFFIGTVFVLAWALPLGARSPSWARDPLYHVLSGGLVLGAFFMATDLVTTPLTRAGRAIFAVGCGLITILIRRYGSYPEGVAFAIIIMNTFVPLIDRWVRPRMYGSRTPKVASREA